jgi:UDP-2,3-diacylglucosamine pyrophosphatase LpxH
VICGHIHHAAMQDMKGIRYINTGDWVESCTAVAENQDGTFEIIRWARSIRLVQDDAERRPDPARAA